MHSPVVWTTTDAFTLVILLTDLPLRRAMSVADSAMTGFRIETFDWKISFNHWKGVLASQHFWAKTVLCERRRITRESQPSAETWSPIIRMVIWFEIHTWNFKLEKTSCDSSSLSSQKFSIRSVYQKRPSFVWFAAGAHSAWRSIRNPP